jgi:N-acetyl sugar amidotransferase
MKIIFCRECLYSSTHPLGITFDDTGLCSGCLIHKEKFHLDWNTRWKKLKQIVKLYKSKKNNYDCIVPVSGGQDSYFILHLVRKLNLNPLVVCYNKYFNTEIGIKNLANLRIKFNCDILFQNVNPVSVKKITRKTLTNFGNMYWPVLAGSTVFPVQISVKYKIPLIIWGAHQGLEQVGMYSHTHNVEMARRYRKDHDLFGYEAENLLNSFDNVREEDIFQYFYPDDFQINRTGTRGIYLGNYVRWDPKSQHELMIKFYNYKSCSFNRTIDTYDYVDCHNYMNIHDLLKLYKHGYSKITDHLTREIRFKRIDKNSALKLVKKYETNKIKNSKLFCDWLGIDQKSLNFLLSSHKNKKFWRNIDIDKWVFSGLNSINLNNIFKNFKNRKFNDLKFFINFKNNFKKNYITFGKGVI